MQGLITKATISLKDKARYDTNWDVKDKTWRSNVRGRALFDRL